MAVGVHLEMYAEIRPGPDAPRSRHDYGRRVSSATVTGVPGRLERGPAWFLVVAFLLCGAAVAAWMLTGHGEGALPLLLLLGAYTVAAYRPLREVVVAAVGMALILLVVLLGDASGFRTGQLLVTYVAFAVLMLIGWITQSRRLRIAALEDQQAEAALRAAADERLRIAREVHDVVAHSLGVIAVQASVGMQVIDTDPAEAKQALEDISGASRSSLAEIRRLLGAVRAEDGGASFAPTPGLSDLERLAHEVEGAGLAVGLEVDGDVDAVPSGVGLAAYRIVQEALTNTVRHAHAHRATVRVDCRPSLVLVQVDDDGRGPSGKRPRGYGLVGMRERVALYDGSLEAGPRPEGGFRVTARLPYEGEVL